MSTRPGRGPRVATIAVLAVIVAACGGDETASPSTTTSPTTTAPAATTSAAITVTGDVSGTVGAGPTTPVSAVPPPETIAPAAAPPPEASALTGVGLAFEPFADVDLPTAMAHRDGDPALYVTSQDGQAWRLNAGTEPESVLDLSDEVSLYESGSERGMLGLAFDPTDGRMYVYYTDQNIDSRVVSYSVGATGQVEEGSSREVLFIDQPGLGHKGGGMAFDPTGLLYIASGDGGASSGRDAQDMSLLLGGILRIDPRADGPGYDVPPDNPFVGEDRAAPELWAKGLRNPWGFSRDPATGDLWTADVGNHTVEEVDRLPAGVGGLNLGWYYLEGEEVMHRGAPANLHPPVYTYSHDEVGPAAIGGRVYRGSAIPALAGAYLFADMSGAFFAVGAGDETVRLDLSRSGLVAAFGTDSAGELYVLTLREGVFRLVPG